MAEDSFVSCPVTVNWLGAVIPSAPSQRGAGRILGGVGAAEQGSAGAMQAAVPSAVAPAGEQLPEERLIAPGDRGGVEARRRGQRGHPHPLAGGVVVDQRQQRAGQRLRIADRHQLAVHPVVDDLARPVRAVGGDDRQTAAHGLDDGHPEGLQAGGDRGDRALGPLRLQRVGRAHQEDVVVQAEFVDQGTQRGLLGAAAVDPQPPVGPLGGDLGEGPYEHVIALDAGEPASRDDPLAAAVGRRESGRRHAVGHRLDAHPGQPQRPAVGAGIGLGDGGDRVEARIGAAQRQLERPVVGVQGEVLLAYPHRAAARLLGDVHIEAGPGADQHVRLRPAQMLGDPAVGELAVLVVAALGGGEDLGRTGVLGIGAVMARTALPEVHEMPQRDPGTQVEDRVVAVPQHGHDLDVMPFGERPGQIERGPIVPRYRRHCESGMRCASVPVSPGLPVLPGLPRGRFALPS